MNSTEDNNFSDFLHNQYKEVQTSLKTDLCLENVKYGPKTLIGEGAQKKVYKVYDQSCSREVAMAVLKNESPQDEAQFLREGRITALLEHPNIMPVYETGKDSEDKFFFTMKLVNGETLQTILDKLQKGSDTENAQYPLLSRLSIFLKVCEALSFAHYKGIIHRDLKPENIQVGEFGEVLLSDWGLANMLFEKCDEKILNDKPLNEIDLKVSLKGLIKGTPGYIAPEILNSKNAYSIQSDIFALGAILHNILTQTVPVNASTAQECIEKTKLGNIEPFYTECTAVHDSLKAICNKALKVKKDERYQSVDEIIHDLNKYLGGFATSAEEAGFLTQLNLFYKRNRRICNLSFVFTLLITFLSAYGIYSIQKEERKSNKILKNLVDTYKEKEKLELELVPIYQEKAHSAFLDVQLDSALAIIELAHKIDPGNKKSRHLFGKMLMAKQDFDSAALMLEGIDDKLFKICKKYSPLKSEVRLSHEELMNFLKEIGTHTRNDIAYIYKNILTEEFRQVKDLDKKVELIKAELYFRNKELQKLHIDIQIVDDSYIIDLSNNPELHTVLILEKLGPVNVKKINMNNTAIRRLDALKYMKIEELHAKNTGLFEMNDFTNHYSYLDAEGSKTDFSIYIKSRPLRFLNIHNSSFSNYHILPTLKYLKTLIVTKGKLPDAIRKQLPTDCQVIEK
ncbi:MAG: serine/threonine protein kinase [Lentisphaeraceae bacterium]|nr:serine/threonine protein kinase [Lentisphaeraceae bacterium]